MPTKTTTKGKIAKPRAVKSPAKKRETMADLKKKIAELEESNSQAIESYGKLKADFYNMQLKHDAMLGLMLRALFVIGIGPDELMAKCSQMFRKKVVAD